MKKVTIYIPKESRNDTERFVGVNGVTYLIKTGQNVEVPPEVAEVINNSLAAIEEAEARKAGLGRV